jgi:hypothetical protein
MKPSKEALPERNTLQRIFYPGLERKRDLSKHEIKTHTWRKNLEKPASGGIAVALRSNQGSS